MRVIGGCELYCGDCLSIMKDMPAASVDMVFCSPPYEDARTYGIGFSLKGQAWVDWSVERFIECLRISRGLVAWVVEGRTRNFQWTATPALLMADLHRRGVKLRKPPIYRRDGVPGSGGPDWLKNHYEFIVCASDGRLPWSDNTACGHPPKFGPGGAPTHRDVNGNRANGSKTTDRKPDGRVVKRVYNPPKIANPGNIINCGPGGGGHLGSDFAHESEAPFPEKLVDVFIKSFCPPNGVVLDPFCGSFTVGAVAIQNNRKAIGIDIRESQIEIATKRIGKAVLPLMGAI